MTEIAFTIGAFLCREPDFREVGRTSSPVAPGILYFDFEADASICLFLLFISLRSDGFQRRFLLHIQGRLANILKPSDDRHSLLVSS